MATGAGIGIHTTTIKETKLHVITEIVKRQIYWARYVDVSFHCPFP
jgi:bacteriorhodopsin